MASDQRNLKIPGLFNQHCYETWEEHVADKKSASQNVDTLALLCILCHKFKSEGRNYEALFFQLLCSCLSSDSDDNEANESTEYRRKCKQRRRPQLFNYQPTLQDSMGLKYVWPIIFNAGQANRVTFYAGIPSQYVHAPNSSEKSESLCAMLFLILSDAVSFRIASSERTRVDCPCLLDYFKLSPENNKNQLPSLIGEYLALLNACFELGFDGAWQFEAVEKTHDFKVIRAAEQKQFSVKTYNRNESPRNFTESFDPSSRAPIKPHGQGKTEFAILIVNCDCSECKLSTMITLEKAAACCESCQRVQAPGIIAKLYGSDYKGKHYITSARNYFDLRFAMIAFDHGDFRRGDGSEGKSFIRSELSTLFRQMTEGIALPLCNSCLVWS